MQLHEFYLLGRGYGSFDYLFLKVWVMSKNNSIVKKEKHITVQPTPIVSSLFPYF